MSFEDILSKYFDKVYTEVDFVKKSYEALKKFCFNDDNAIAAVCVCRDEISQSMRSIVKHMWGEAFNLSSLAGMFTAGKTGLKAAMVHAPRGDGKERYVYYVIPKITRKVIQTDLEHVLEKIVDTTKSDYAIMTGIQIHGPDSNYVWPAECYA